MRIEYQLNFKKNLEKFPQTIQDKFDKQAGFLLKNIRHPSLRAKKYDEIKNIWQARVDKNVRFYFKIEEDVYILINIKHHPK